MAHADGQPVERVELAERLLGDHLQHDRLHRDLRRRQRDAVVVGEIADRLDVRVARVEEGRLAVHRHHAAHVHVAARLVPQREEARQADPDDIDIAREQRIADRGRRTHAGIDRRHLAEARTLGRPLDHLLVLHHVELQVSKPELAREAHLVGFRARRAAEREHQQASRENP